MRRPTFIELKQTNDALQNENFYLRQQLMAAKGMMKTMLDARETVVETVVAMRTFIIEPDESE
jgi:hypothetical protein